MADDDTSTAPVFDMMTDSERLVAVTRELATAQAEAATYKERTKGLKEQIKLLKQPAQPVQGGNTMANNQQPAPAAAVVAPTSTPPIVPTVTPPAPVNVTHTVTIGSPIPWLGIAFVVAFLVIAYLAVSIVEKYFPPISSPAEAAQVEQPADTKAGDPPAAKADEAKAADEATTPPKVDTGTSSVGSFRIKCGRNRELELRKTSEEYATKSVKEWAAIVCPATEQAPPASDTPPASVEPAEVPKSTPVDFNFSNNTITIFGGGGCNNGCCAAKKGCEKKIDEPTPAKKATCCQARPPKPKKQVVKQVPECVPYAFEGSLSRSGAKYVFVTNEADARCLTGKKVCGDCKAWIRGHNGPVNGPANAVVGPNSLAYKVNLEGGIVMMPARLRGPVAACDQGKDGRYDSRGLYKL